MIHRLLHYSRCSIVVVCIANCSHLLQGWTCLNRTSVHQEPPDKLVLLRGSSSACFNIPSLMSASTSRKESKSGPVNNVINNQIQSNSFTRWRILVQMISHAGQTRGIRNPYLLLESKETQRRHTTFLIRKAFGSMEVDMME
ncbi:uncharacterized protein HD556DRAFT_304363 [Suillus plorans]|uniref:Uncharacterized protein n=1 Tax=Suillus plorans TaxID=116603 RepID=A0A9P7DYG5_9AGAM|nr:uncharacterized protein HD556DRAFT_304363 [Suillus plorans]KAG1806275.1 hypothetical protein HD556DRAFT_304363 [Suillus plorans]